jgi:hypothetical protein
MAHSTETTFNNGVHRDVVGTCAHLETKLRMTDLAAKPYPMKPMGIDYRPHSVLFRSVIKHHISIF